MGVQEAQHVVVRPDQEGNRIRERLVVGQHPGVDMTMRRDQGEPGYGLVQVQGQPAQLGPCGSSRSG